MSTRGHHGLLLAGASAVSAPIYLSNTPSSFSTSATSHLVSMPATVSSGDLLVVITTTRNSSGGAVSLRPVATGFSNILTQLTGASTTQGNVYTKTATGTEGGTTVDFATPANVDSLAAQVIRIQSGTWSSSVASSSSADSGSNMTPDPPLLASGWGGLNALFICGFCSNGAADPVSWPMPDNQLGTTSGGASNTRVISCTQVSSAGTVDPSVFTMSANTRWASFTLAVRPV